MNVVCGSWSRPSLGKYWKLSLRIVGKWGVIQGRTNAGLYQVKKAIYSPHLGDKTRRFNNEKARKKSLEKQ